MAEVVEFLASLPTAEAIIALRPSESMSIVLAYQPHFINQPADVQVFWGYALFSDRRSG
ncbi:MULTISPECIES: oleate hydratase [unclassified Nostoc]|nr:MULTISPECIES: oleate hydratase [unclassified Nostoc]